MIALKLVCKDSGNTFTDKIGVGVPPSAFYTFIGNHTNADNCRNVLAAFYSFKAEFQSMTVLVGNIELTMERK